MTALERIEAFAARVLNWGSRRFLVVCALLGRRLTQRRLARGRVRTLWGITPIITLSLKARANHALGFKSDSVVFTTYYITKRFTWNLNWVGRALNAWPLASRAGHRCLLGIALLRYDVFHYFADRGIVPSGQRFGVDIEELAMIQRAGKPVYIFAYGADVRTRQATLDLGRWNFCVDCPDPGRHCVCDDATGREIMQRMSPYVTGMVSLGDMLTYMPDAHHVAYWPIDVDAITAASPLPHDGPLRIAHAPNHTHFKGTSYLEASIARLNAQGIAIELVRISGVPNEDVLRLFASSDIVADQFIGGAYGYTALEALAAGKPVLTYVRSADLAVESAECPFLMATPDTLDRVLTWCAANRSALPAIGLQGRAYVERHHSIDAVAARLAALYRATAAFPEPLNERLAEFEAREVQRRAAVLQVDGWRHPWRLAKEHADV